MGFYEKSYIEILTLPKETAYSVSSGSNRFHFIRHFGYVK